MTKLIIIGDFMKILHMIALTVAVAILTGCAATKSVLAKRDNGSLDYRTAKTLDPIKLPVNQPAAEFIPLYQTPKANGALPNFVNESGKQYQLPRPPSVR